MAREVANLSIGTRDAFPLVGLFVRITHRAYIGAKSSFTSGAAKLVTTDKTGGAPVTPHIAREVANLSIGTRDAFPLIGFFIGIADATGSNTSTTTICISASTSANIIAAD
jgi:hypothetical protein